MPERPESNRVLNCLPSPQQDLDWGLANAFAADVLGAPAELPASVDLRAPWWTIGDQGSTGSCVGWASADSVIRWHLVKVRRLPRSRRLSPRFLWMASKETDEFNQRPTTFIESDGTSLKAALDVARKFGTVEDSVLPFRTGALYAGSTNDFYAIAAQRKIAAYFNLGRDLQAWRTWLATTGPILTRLGVDRTWDEATQNQGQLARYQPNTVRGGHAIALVGYTPTSFIVRNSWGTGWGDGGFAYASLDYAAAAFTESYGVTL
jgi:hypothetical protein